MRWTERYNLLLATSSGSTKAVRHVRENRCHCSYITLAAVHSIHSKEERVRTSYPRTRALPAASPPSPISKYSKGNASLMSVGGGMCLDQCRYSSIVLLEPLLGSRAPESNGRTQFSNALLTLSVKSGVDSRPRTSLRGTYHPCLVPRRQAVICTIQGGGGCPDVTSPFASSPHATL